ALQSLATVVVSKNLFSRDFRRRPISDFSNNIEGLADKLNSEQKGVTLASVWTLPVMHRGRWNLVHCFIRAPAKAGFTADEQTPKS
ncbi:MAG: hypothetical protein WBX77_12300, partial [Pseudolabrys sp.]